jgi:hypothetical protein
MDLTRIFAVGSAHDGADRVIRWTTAGAVIGVAAVAAVVSVRFGKISPFGVSEARNAPCAHDQHRLTAEFAIPAGGAVTTADLLVVIG